MDCVLQTIRFRMMLKDPRRKRVKSLLSQDSKHVKSRDPGIEPMSLTPPTMARRFFTTSATRKPCLSVSTTTAIGCPVGKERCLLLEYKKGWFKMNYCVLASGLFLTATGKQGTEGLRREGLT